MATSAQKKQVDGWVRKWKSALFLDQWSIRVEHVPVDKVDMDNGTICLASINVLPEYFSAYLQVSESLFAEAPTKEEQEKCILHELVHCVTAETRNLSLEATKKNRQEMLRANERLTEWVTNAIWNAKKPKKGKSTA